jgi:hypothetical protein
VGGLRYLLTDPNNKPIEAGVLAGPLKRTGIKQGNYTIDLFGIVNAQWSTKQSEVGKSVDLIVDTIGIKDGEKATLDIFIRDSNYADHMLATLESKVSGDKVTASWTMSVEEKYLGICSDKATKKRYSLPFFFFKVKIGDLAEQSGLLFIVDWVEIVLKDADGKPVKNGEYKVTLGTGEIKNGTLDGDGKTKIKDIQPGIARIQFKPKK